MFDRYSLLLICGLAATTGCTSMSSTMFTRDESNTSWSRKGGLKGVPITLKVPTHLELTVHERHYLYKKGDSLQRMALTYPVRHVSHKFVMGEKIFTVDFKRPAGGSFALGLDFNAGQGFDKITHNIVDETIEQLADALGGADVDVDQPDVPQAAAGEVTDDPEKPKKAYAFYRVDSVVAVQLFEIDAPDFEQQISEFLNLHLNQAHDAWVAPSDVEHFHRTRVSNVGELGDVPNGALPPPDASSYSADGLPPVVDRRQLLPTKYSR